MPRFVSALDGLGWRRDRNEMRQMRAEIRTRLSPERGHAGILRRLVVELRVRWQVWSCMAKRLYGHRG